MTSASPGTSTYAPHQLPPEVGSPRDCTSAGFSGGSSMTWQVSGAVVAVCAAVAVVAAGASSDGGGASVEGPSAYQCHRRHRLHPAPAAPSRACKLSPHPLPPAPPPALALGHYPRHATPHRLLLVLPPIGAHVHLRRIGVRQRPAAAIVRKQHACAGGHGAAPRVHARLGCCGRRRGDAGRGAAPDRVLRRGKQLARAALPESKGGGGRGDGEGG